VRPIPDWLRTVQLAVGPGATRHHVPLGARRLWLVTAAVLSLGAALMLLLASGRTHDRDHVSDAAFVKAAGRRCSQASDEAQAVRSSVSGIGGEDRAARADGVASAWARAVDDLHDQPVLGADRGKVERWLRTWDEWTTLGHDYARAVEAGDDTGAEAILTAAEADRNAIARFALVNSIAACAP
jgi:hypothetical protein